MICSGVLAVVCFLFGIIFSYGCSTPAGASVVLVNLAAFIVFSVVQSVLMRVTKSKNITTKQDRKIRSDFSGPVLFYYE